MQRNDSQKGLAKYFLLIWYKVSLYVLLLLLLLFLLLLLYLLSKLFWHFTVSSVSKTWVTENIDIPISGTLSTVFLTRNKFGLSICPPSVKFIQCQTVLRKALKTSPNEAINELWKATSNSKNIQYDVYNSTKQVLKDFRSGQEDKLHTQLTCQGSFFTNITKFSLSQLTKIWSACQSNLPKNIFNFTVRYINNSLPTCQNLARWGLFIYLIYPKNRKGAPTEPKLQ